MAGCQCAVANCPNKKKDKLGGSVSFHKFPKTASIRSIWRARCGRGDEFNADSAYVCSEHFTKDDYDGVLRAELMNLPYKKMLKKTAIPSVGVFVEESLTKAPIFDIENIIPDDDFQIRIDQATPELLKSELILMHKKLRMLILEYENLKAKSTEQENKIKELQKENSLLKKKLFSPS